MEPPGSVRRPEGKGKAMKRTAVRMVPGAAAIAVALAGCGVGGGSSSATETVTQTVTETVDSSGAAEDAEPAEAEPADGSGESEGGEEPAKDSDADDNIAPFGETLKRGDGLEVTVSAPESFTPGRYAAGGEGSAEHVRFEVTLKNGTDEAFDPSMLYATVTSGGVEGEEIFDDGLDGAPMTTLLPGKSVTYPVGFGVKDSSDVLMEIELDWVGETAIFGTKSALS